MNLYLLNYKSYGDRRGLQGFDTLEEYISTRPSFVQEDIVNFNFADGVRTKQVVDTNDQYNYAILTDDNDVIHSRYFIMENNYLSEERNEVVLFRDLVYDLKDIWQEAPSMIHRGFTTSNLIFNNEGNSYNQVKKTQTSIQDKSEGPWIAIYYDKDQNISGDISLSEEYDIEAGISYENWDYHDIVGINQVSTPYETKVKTKWKNTKKTAEFAEIEVSGWYKDIDKTGFLSAPMYDINTDRITYETIANRIQEHMAEFEEFIGGIDESDYDYLFSINGKKIKFTDGVYQVSFQDFNNGVDGELLEPSTDSDIAQYMLELVPEIIQIRGDAGKAPIRVKYKYDISRLDMTKITSGNLEYSIGTGGKVEVQDAPYGICLLPYFDRRVATNGTDWIEMNKDLNLRIATEIMRQNGGTSPKVYDVQIIPYQPINFSDRILRLSDPDQYQVLTVDGKDISCFYYPSSISFQRRAYFDAGAPGWLKAKTDADEIKIQNETEFVRFCAPNYSSSFEMSVSKNNGISWIGIYGTLKPYNPYFRVAPSFKGLYGADFKDNRGLVFTGDFSISSTTSEWETYQRQNVNYEKAWNRQIETLDAHNSLARQADIAGIIGGGISGAGAGASLGLGAGGLVSGIVGAVAGVGAGIADAVINEQMRQVDRKNTIDQHNFALGNVQALPNTLSKVSAYNIDNNYMPFVERYVATDEEVEALRQQISVRDFRIGVIGQPKDYMRNFISCEPIVLDLDDDNHMREELINELVKGVRII